MCPSIDPGSFTQLLTFLSQTTGSDASGASIVYSAGNPPLTAWGSVKTVRGTDKIAAGQDVTTDFSTIKMWWEPWVATSMRIQLPSGSVVIIQAIENVDQLNTYLVLTCLGLGANV